nr:hypothetical protein [Hypnea sp.]
MTKRKRIGNNTCLKYKSFITIIYHIFIQLKNIPIAFFLIVYILVYNNTKKNIENHRKLAFNTCILDFENYIKTHKSTIDIRIIGFNQKKIFKILPAYKNKVFKYIHKINVKKILEYIRSTGIFKKTEYYIINIYHFKYFIIQIHINSIVKQIKIKKYKNLQIPSQLLINIFKDQLGSPVNYHKINDSIYKMYSWYINKGFSYIYIKLKYKNNSQILSLQIFEGKIRKKYLVCESQNIFHQTLIDKIEKILVKELHISEGSIFNIKKVEQGIKYLKSIKLITDCKYTIQQNKEGLHLKIKYSMFTNHYGYLYHQKLIIENIQNSFFWHILNDKIQNILQTIIYNLNKNSQKYIKKLPKTSQDFLFKIKYKNNFEKILPSTYLNFKYYFSCLNSNYKTDIKFINQTPYFECLILSPYIEFQNHILNSVQLNFYKKKYKVKTLYLTDNNQIEHFSKKRVNLEAYIKSKYNLISVKHNIYKDLSCKENYINVYNSWKKQFLHLRKYYLSNNLRNLNLKLRIYKKSIKQKLLLLSTQIKYNNFEYTKFLQSGRVFILEFLFFKPQKIMQLNNLYKSIYGNNNVNLKYYQTFLLPNILPYIKKNALNIFGEINYFTGTNNYGKLFNNTTNAYLQMYFQDKYERIIKYHSRYSYKIEYHISIYNFLSYYIFSDVHNKPYYIYKIRKYTHITGLGIQINIPIKAIPIIRLEYRTSNCYKDYYQLRLFSSFIKYNN